MTTSNFIDHDTWFAQLPGVVVAAGALITDPSGRILLVKPNYRDHWTLPGGICEHGEPPHLGCAREVEHCRQIAAAGTSAEAQVKIFTENEHEGADIALQKVARWIRDTTLVA